MIQQKMIRLDGILNFCEQFLFREDMDAKSEYDFTAFKELEAAEEERTGMEFSNSILKITSPNTYVCGGNRVTYAHIACVAALAERFCRECGVPIFVRRLDSLNSQFRWSGGEVENEDWYEEEYNFYDYLRTYADVSPFFSLQIDGLFQNAAFGYPTDEPGDSFEPYYSLRQEVEGLYGENLDEAEVLEKYVRQCYSDIPFSKAPFSKYMVSHFSTMAEITADATENGGEAYFAENFISSKAVGRYFDWMQKHPEERERFCREDRILRRCIAEITQPIYFKYQDMCTWCTLDGDGFLVGYATGESSSGTLLNSSLNWKLFFAIVSVDCILLAAENKYGILKDCHVH